MMSQASAAAHRQEKTPSSQGKLAIWECREPGCKGHRSKDKDGIHWTCQTCGASTNPNKVATQPAAPAKGSGAPRRPVLVDVSAPSPQWLRDRYVKTAALMGRRE